MQKCNFHNRPGLSPAAREVGCPLDHCPKGHHLTTDITTEAGVPLHEDAKEHPECYADRGEQFVDPIPYED